MGTKTTLRAMQENHEPIEWTTCEVCCSQVRARFAQEFMGVTYCPWCTNRNAKKRIVELLFVRSVAKQPCERPHVMIKVWVEASPGFEVEEDWQVDACALDCKCIPCMARRIIKWRPPRS
jgi:hypothetical protein